MGTLNDVATALNTVAQNQTEIKARLSDLETKAETKRQRASIVMTGNPWDEKGLSYEEKQQTASFLKYLAHGEKRLQASEMKSLVEDSTGQILVPAAIEADIFRAAATEGTIRPLASVRTTTRDRIQVRNLSYLSAGWGKLETGTVITESTLTPTEATVYVEDLYALTKIGEDELADAEANLQQIVVEEFRKRIPAMENTAFIAGTGHTYSQPNGIIADATLLAAAKTTTAAAAVTIEDMLGAIYTVPSEYRKGLSIIVHSQTELALRSLRAGGSAAGDGAFLWQPSTIAGTPNTFAGFPIFSDDNLGTLAGTEQVIAIVGNLKAGYRIYDRLGMTVQYIDQLYTESGLVAWKVHFRVGGCVIRASDKRIVLLKEHA